MTIPYKGAGYLPVVYMTRGIPGSKFPGLQRLQAMTGKLAGEVIACCPSLRGARLPPPIRCTSESSDRR